MSDDISTKTVKINYTEYQVPEHLVIDLCNILMDVKDSEFKPVCFTVEEGKNPEREQLAMSARKEAEAETSQYRDWWLADRKKIEKLEAQIAEMKEQSGE